MIINLDYLINNWEMESCNFEEGFCFLSQQNQKLSVIYTSITVKVSFFNHFFDLFQAYRKRIRMNDLLYIGSSQFPIAIYINFQKLSSKHLLVSSQSCIDKASNKFRIMHQSSIIKVHCSENLINFFNSKRKTELFLELLKTYDHLLSSYHAISIGVKPHKYLSQMLNLFLGDIHGQMHKNGLLQAMQTYFYSFIFTSLLRPMMTYYESLNYQREREMCFLTQGCQYDFKAVYRFVGSFTSNFAIKSLDQTLHLWNGYLSNVQIPFLMLIKIEGTSLPQKGGLPHNSIYSMTPQAQLSTYLPYFPVITQGARYIVVPLGLFQNSLFLIILAIPKSISFILLMFPFSFRRIFYGFKSRWETLWQCIYAIAENICLMMTAV